MRLQLALNVDNLDTAIAYYAKLFDVHPHKVRPGYANFIVDSPPLKLVLFESRETENRLNHLVSDCHHAGEELLNASIQTVNQDAYLAKIPEGIAV